MKMKKGLLTMLALLSMGSVFAQDFTFPDARVVTANTTRQGVVQVKLNSTSAYRDLQFELTLPEGITLVKESVSPDSPDATNVKAGASGHVIAYNPVGTAEGNVVRFAVYDQTNGNLFSNDVLIEIPVKFATGKTTDVATVDNIIASNASAESLPQNEDPINFNVVLVGDVEGDGVVDVQDIVTLISKIQRENPTNFIGVAADVFEDNEWDVQDVTGIVDIIQSGSGSSPAKKYVVEENVIEPE